MRRLVVAIAMVLGATAAMAAEADQGKTQLSIFTSNLGFVVTNRESDSTGGLGLALSRAITPHWSAELRVAEERHLTSVTTYSADPTVLPVTQRRTFRVIPVDLLTQYRFPNVSRWTPYVSAGVRYVSAGTVHAPKAEAPPGLTPRPELFGDRMSAQLGVGTTLRITPHFGMRFDVDTLLRSHDVFYDPLLRPSVGVTWHF